MVFIALMGIQARIEHQQLFRTGWDRRTRIGHS